MRRQEQLQAEHDRAEEDVFAKVAVKEKLDKEVCGGQRLRRGGEGGRGVEGRREERGRGRKEDGRRKGGRGEQSRLKGREGKG